jgi:hypothetical protein
LSALSFPVPQELTIREQVGDRGEGRIDAEGERAVMPHPGKSSVSAEWPDQHQPPWITPTSDSLALKIFRDRGHQTVLWKGPG